MGASAKVFTLIVLTALASGCSSRSAKGVDADRTNDVGQTSDVGQTRDFGQTRDVGQAPDVAQDAPPDTTIVAPANVMFPEAPEVACGGDATAECPFPPSACAAPSCDGGFCPGLAWVVYYDSPTCVNSKCAYTKRYFECDVSLVCSAGGCRFNGTLAASQ